MLRLHLLLITSCFLGLAGCGHATPGQIAKNAAGMVIAEKVEDDFEEFMNDTVTSESTVEAEGN